jgi:hypothetical protein
MAIRWSAHSPVRLIWVKVTNHFLAPICEHHIAGFRARLPCVTAHWDCSSLHTETMLMQVEANAVAAVIDVTLVRVDSNPGTENCPEVSQRPDP